MASTSGIKIEDPTAHLEITIEEVPLNLVEYGPENDVFQNGIHEVDENHMFLNVFHDGDEEDMHQRRRWEMPPEDTPILPSSRCDECGISLNQYIETRNYKIMKKLHKKCFKKCYSCPHCGLKLSHSVNTRQQRLYRDKHSSCPPN